MQKVSLLIVAIAAAAVASVRVYDVAPYRCCDGLTAGGNGSYVAGEPRDVTLVVCLCGPSISQTRS
jgi:hypothetical protein